MTYAQFLESKRQLSGDFGFDPVFMPGQAFGFQRQLIEFACRKGRAAIFADCGLGKTLMQLTWAENVRRVSGGRVLILTPLAVSHQTVAEADKFGIPAARSDSGELPSDIVVTNYQRLHHFRPEDFEGVVCDESSILKNFDGATKAAITEFMRTRKYRLLCTATAAPNDFIELGTSSEALGHLGHKDMLTRFFTNNGAWISRTGKTGGRFFNSQMRADAYHLKPHAERDFWRWVCSWSRAIRKPSDIGFLDEGFSVPPLVLRHHIVTARAPHPEYLFTLPASGLSEQRQERSRTLQERCEMAASIAMSHDRPHIAWCHLNSEGDALEKMIDGAVQVSGDDADERKEEVFRAFESGAIRALVTKPTIAGFGLNWQHCADMTFFPSHSFEQWYQAIRRCWRFGQTRAVTVDVISSEGEADVLKNLRRKADAADAMFAEMVNHMRQELTIKESDGHTKKGELPVWLSTKK